MKKGKLIYVMDPQCGWSFSNERSISDLFDLLKESYDFEFIPGGMWNNSNAPRGGKAIKDFLLPSILRLNHFSSQEISDSYIDLICDSTYLLSSDWASQAIVTVNKLYPQKSLLFIHELMKQQFVFGKRFDVERTYLEVLEKLEMDSDIFLNYWKGEDAKKELIRNYKKASNISYSYPSLILEHSKGFEVLHSGTFKTAEVINELNKRNKNSKAVVK